MPGIPSLFGDGAALGLGSGPIRSQDQNAVGFTTGSFGTGSSTQSGFNFTLIVVFLIGVILWLLYSSSR